MSAAGTSWKLGGTLLIACNCDYGCPCNFNALPSHGKQYVASAPFDYAGP